MGDTSRLVAMDETEYDSERVLQELLAGHPDLLAGEQISPDSPRRWLLITRELSVPGAEEGPPRWSLDHLFLDQDAVPTLVEVKRSSDTRIRRAVIGQMLDYAANAVVYWPVDHITTSFAARCRSDRRDPEQELARFLNPDVDAAEFWQRAKTNLQAGRVRLVFVADTIPPELRRIVEFLNEQMDPAEVLAIEVKQFVANGMKTLVPRVFGQTESARIRKTGGVILRNWNESLFMTALKDAKGNASQVVAKEILDWIRPQVDELWFGRGEREGGVIPIVEHGGVRYHLCRLTTRGWFVFRFDWLYRKPPFADESVRRELLAKINAIPDVQFGEEILTKRARIPLESLRSALATAKLKEAIACMVDQIRANAG
jgi:hypothetical protein